MSRVVYEWMSYARVWPFEGELHHVAMVSEGASTPWSWTSLPGVDNCGRGQRWAMTGQYMRYERRPCSANVMENQRAWLVSERWATAICNQCGGSAAWHVHRLCEERRPERSTR